jgi:hypothetical protein
MSAHPATARERGFLTDPSVVREAIQLDPDLGRLSDAVAPQELGARVARAFGLDLAAQRAAEAFLASADARGSEPGTRSLLAEVATSRGDLTSARAALREAEAAGADSIELSRARRQVAEALAPQVVATLEAGSSDTGLNDRSLGAGTALHPGWVGAEVQAVARVTERTQGAQVRRIGSVGIRVDSLFLGDAAAISVEAGAWMAEGGNPSPAARLRFEFERENRSTFGLVLDHGPVSHSAGGVDPLRPARMRSLALLAPDLAETEGRLTAAFRGVGHFRRNAAELEGGGTRYSDGNRRGFASARLVLSIVDRGGISLGVEPNLYGEGFARRTRGLLTHQAFGSLGTRFGVRVSLPAVVFDVVANPHLFRYVGSSSFETPDAIGFGVDGRAVATLRFGRAAAEVTASFLDQQVLRTFGLAVGAALAVP